MGGKRNVANRTKNNAKPSNSGRSADLLGTSITHFVGFSGNKESSFGYSLTNFDDLDPNVQVILKRIQKKDSTTKIKGLQDFAKFVIESDLEVVKLVLPIWPRFYSSLVTDEDNRVRETTQYVHQQIVLKVKRNIAPYLKQLMPLWCTSQYDTHPPAASIASQAFRDTFPSNKIQEAIVYCQEEILNYLSDNLLVQTAQSLSHMKNYTKEEAEAKYERTLISCLQGYTFYLEKVSVEQIKNAADLNNNIISNEKFWKFSKIKIPHIRSSLFNIISIMCQKAPFLLEDKASRVVTCVFGSMEEQDPTVLPRIWEAALSTMTTIKNWWSFIKIDKLFLPKLWKILKSGGRGNATIIFPIFLPLISHLPPEIEETVPQFYDEFFENMWSGLKQKSTSLSRSESAAIATAFVECLQYVILKKQSDIPFCKSLIKNHLITSIEGCLIDDQISYKSFFNQISSLVQCWRKKSDVNASKIFLEFFLENIRDTFKDTLFNVKEIDNLDVGKVAEKHLEILHSLKCISKPKKQLKVKFNEETDKSQEPKSDNSSTISDDKAYLQRLNTLVYYICDDYVNYTSENNSTVLIEHLYSLIIDFGHQNFFKKLLQETKKKNSDFQPIDIFSNILSVWLFKLSSKYIVSLIFLLFEYLPEEKEKKLVLDTLLKVPSEEALGWCISEAFAHPHNRNPLVKEWMRSERISSFLVSITDKIISDECSPEHKILFRLALTENEFGELYIQEEVILNIVSKLKKTIEHYLDYTLTADTCTSLAAYISAIIYTENLLLKYSDSLLLALFRLSCNSEIDNEIISEDTMYEVTSAWQDALSLLCKNLSIEESLNLTRKLVDIIEEIMLSNDLEESNINYLINAVVNVAIAIYKSLPLHLTEFLNIFFERKSNNFCYRYFNELCVLADYISGKHSSPYQEVKVISDNDTVEKLKISKYFAWAYMTLGVISSSLKEAILEYNDEDVENNDDETCEEKKEVIFFSVIDRPEVYIAQFLHDISLANTYLDTFKNTRYYDPILHCCVLIEIKIKEVIQKSDSVFQSNLNALLKEKCTEEGWHWCSATYYLYSKILPRDLEFTYKKLVADVPEAKNVYILHLIQTFKNHLNYDFIPNKFDDIGDIVVLNSLVNCNEIDVQIAEAFTKMEKIRLKDVPKFLYQSHEISWKECQEIIEIIRVLSSLVKYKFQCLSQKHWDFGTVSLVGWASNCLKAKENYKNYQFQTLLCAVVNLYVNTDTQMKSLKEQGEAKQFVEEWEDVLAGSAHDDLLKIWLYLAEKLNDDSDVTTYLPFILQYSSLLSNLNWTRIFNNDNSLPKWSTFVEISCKLLVNPHPILQLWGYKMLIILVPGLINIDTESVNTNTPHKMGLIFEQFKNQLIEIHKIVDSMLEGFKLGEDSCRVEPRTDSFTYTFAYLLLWDVLLTLCEKSSSEVRFQYTDWLKNENLLKKLLENLFKLMPTDVLHCNEEKLQYFEKLNMDVKDTCDSETIENLVCCLYYSTMGQLPAMARQWWLCLDGKIAQIVEKVTQVYVSPNLIAKEFYNLSIHQDQFKNTVLKFLPGAREVIAIYTRDEHQVELSTIIPVNYPLGSIDVQFSRDTRNFSGAPKDNLLPNKMYKMYLINQNGNLLDGLSMWNKNIEKRFEGLEDCYICYAQIHPVTLQLPKKSCRTCKNKFHSACLYKWFKVSLQSTCPICRNLF